MKSRCLILTIVFLGLVSTSSFGRTSAVGYPSLWLASSPAVKHVNHRQLATAGPMGLPSAAQLRASAAPQLPGLYFRLMEASIPAIEAQVAANPTASLESFEAGGDGYNLFSHVALMAAVLYARRNPSNHHYHEGKMLDLATHIGDLLASETEHGVFADRLNSDRDAYVWLETYRLLKQDLGTERKARWRRGLEKNIADLDADVVERTDFPGYQSPFIGTAPNHYALWASTVYLAGRVFANHKWENDGARVMHRFAAQEQSPDGFWGEHDRLLPTPGYDYNTYASMSLYAEFSHDPAALQALRRGLTFHEFFTYPNGWPVETLDDRNRYTEIAGWGKSGIPTWPAPNSPIGGNDESAAKGQFGFSNFADGRRYAEFLAGFFRPGLVGYEDLGRIAQDALYYHSGPLKPIPQDLPDYFHRLSIPAGIRKTGPWVVCLSGLISTRAVTNQFYLDRQGNLSIFHQKLGLIITGANSKRQPELATFWEKLPGQIFYMPLSSRLQMGGATDRLSLAYNTFFTDLYVQPPSVNGLSFRFVITGKGRPPEEASLNLQLCLKAGETLETGAGQKILLGADRIDLSPEALGGWIRHHGWMLKIDPTAHLVWPVYSYNPYANGPETALKEAVGVLSVPLRLKREKNQPRYSVLQEISFALNAD